MPDQIADREARFYWSSCQRFRLAQSAQEREDALDDLDVLCLHTDNATLRVQASAARGALVLEHVLSGPAEQMEIRVAHPGG